MAADSPVRRPGNPVRRREHARPLKPLRRKPKELTAEAYRALTDHHWPGNVRELKNLIERIVILNPQVRVDARHIPLTPARRSSDGSQGRFGSLQDTWR